MAVIGQETRPENPSFVIDRLYCEEQQEGDLGECSLELEEIEKFDEWDDNEIVRLLSKEKETILDQSGLNSDGSLMVARTDAIEWMLRIIANYGFTGMTTALAVNNFDRFISSIRFHRDEPWMSQLAAAACLSLAAKVEGTQVPLLLELQIEESKYVFEAKTIQRMELLRCERLILAIITDSRSVCCLPSVLAAATVLHVIKEVEPCNALDYKNELMDVLNLNLSRGCVLFNWIFVLPYNDDKVDGLSKLIQEFYGNDGDVTHKRKYESLPASPNGVVDAHFCSDCSNTSWSVTSSVSSSPEPLFKKRRDGEQKTRLDPLMHMSIGLVGSHR
ncbi:hypothetical protein Vadar_013394 [Vaccinium darrowii]|uniref:Uncharacterized protein n=1 Tax=Vaccinium darrowii TaxID=229202 RepID=A0ACB7YDD6_9ERIC|nr:hypothetical protein Vadar_013394 [Vaccinium darrowii]